MKILFVWTGITQFAGDCWRALAAQPDVSLKVVVDARRDEGLAGAVLRNVDFVWADDPPSMEVERPDVLFAVGWRSRVVRSFVERADWRDVPKVMTMDMPWRWKFRCIAARFVLWRYCRRFRMVFVPGASAFRYARWLGFRRIERGLLAIDVHRFAEASRKVPVAGRRGFLYVGRDSVEKRLDLTRRAYERYRELGGRWEIEFHHKTPYTDLPGVFARSACLVMSSAHDPWPLVVLEAKAAGCDVIVSDRCGNRLDLEAKVVPFGDVEATARAMLDVERGFAQKAGNALPAENALRFYDCSEWTRRVMGICREVRRGGFFCPGMDDVANGMAVVARMLSEDARFCGAYLVHGAWLPSGWLQCVKRLVSGRGYARMPHGSYSPVYLSGSGRLKKWLVRPIERWLLRRAEKVIATCEAERQWIEAYEPKAKVEVVDLRKCNWGCGKKGKASCSASENPRTAPLRVLYMGRRHPLKGVQYLEEAVREANSEAAGGSKQWNLGQTYFLLFELRVVTDARGEEKEAAFDWCDVLCLPTLSENFGIVVAEALARGKPVITTDGAPAWADEPRKNPDGTPRLLYVEGFCDATPDMRVQMLKAALRQSIML